MSRLAGRIQAVTSPLIEIPKQQETSCNHCLADAYLTNLSSKEILYLDLGGFVRTEKIEEIYTVGSKACFFF